MEGRANDLLYLRNDVEVAQPIGFYYKLFHIGNDDTPIKWVQVAYAILLLVNQLGIHIILEICIHSLLNLKGITRKNSHSRFPEL